MNNQVSQTQIACARWSNRILILSLIGIACLTLFPFQFSSAGRIALHESPFLLGATGKNASPTDFFLNVLLFVPFGFGVSAQRIKRGGTAWTAFLLSLIAGALASYTVELLQFYIPLRNSGWDDIFSNTIGSVAGFFVFQLCGVAILGIASTMEDGFERWLSLPRTAALLLAYFAIWGAISIPLQHQTRLSNWDRAGVLVVGNSATGHHEWKGQVFRLQIWNRALPKKLVYQMTAGATPPDDESGLLASYDFTTPPPFLDETKHLPALGLVHASSSKPASSPPGPQKDSSAAAPIDLNGAWWLSTKVPVEELTSEIQKTNQFTVRIVCAAAGFANTDERIVSLSASADRVNFHLRQEGASLVLWFRNPLSESRSSLAWYVRDVFQPGQTRNIVASYDGADAFLYLDGKSVPESYRLSPGASLRHRFSFVQTAELKGSVFIYETLVFLPAGLLIGVAAREGKKWRTSGKLLILFGVLLPPVILDLFLVSISGRRMHLENIFFSALLSVAGILLINADSIRGDARRKNNSPHPG